MLISKRSPLTSLIGKLVGTAQRKYSTSGKTSWLQEVSFSSEIPGFQRTTIVYNCILKLYKEYFWKDSQNHRKYFDWLSAKLNITTQHEWYSVGYLDVVRNQGKKMLEQYHNYSFHKAIERVYPEYDWYIWLFKNSSRNYWEHRENQQRYLDWLSSVLGVVTQHDWYSVLLEDVLENGGAMLCGKHGGSHGTALQTLYPQYEWYPWLFTHSPSKFWSSWSNQRRYLNWVAEELGIETQHQWYSVSNEEIISMQGTTLLGQHNSSMHRALQYIYPEYEWHGWFFEILPRNYWKAINNQRKFLDWIESEAHIEHKEQWYTTDTNQLRTLGIHRLLCIYNNSLLDMLQTVYHENTWYPWLFDRVPPRYWADENNIRAFIHWMARKLRIEKKEDWYAVTYPQIYECGGSTLVKQEGLPALLSKYYYSDFNMDSDKFLAANKSQSALYSVLQQLLKDMGFTPKPSFHLHNEFESHTHSEVYL